MNKTNISTATAQPVSQCRNIYKSIYIYIYIYIKIYTDILNTHQMAIRMMEGSRGGSPGPSSQLPAQASTGSITMTPWDTIHLEQELLAAIRSHGIGWAEVFRDYLQGLPIGDSISPGPHVLHFVLMLRDICEAMATYSELSGGVGGASSLCCATAFHKSPDIAP